MKQIPLSKGLVAMVDDEDYDALSRHRWYASGTAPYVYARRDGGSPRKVIAMHRVIAKALPRLVVDHLNGDTLDNRRANLRVCTQSHNIGNAKVARRNNKTGFKGVSWRPDRNKYAAQIKVGRKTRHLGFFPTAVEASTAYQKAARAAFFTAD